MKVVRIGFPIISSRTWMGGYNYLLSLISALAGYESDRVQPILFCGKDTPQEDLLPFNNIDGLQIVSHEAFSKKSQSAGLMQALVFGKNIQASQAFSAELIDVIFEPARFYGWRLKQNGLAWFPDFQHRHMPHLFGRTSWLKREIGFRMQAFSGHTILLSSDDASKDCKKFYNIKQEKIEILKFPALIPPKLLEFDTSSLQALYDLPGKFAYIPNQFWQHKNHEVVIKALGILKENGLDITVISTGSTHDPRNPEHFQDLQSKIQALNISDNFRILGLIPREHAIGLLRTCTLLINPSLFEGWNTSVEEAKAMGVPMLLSNISVHQEQTRNNATYFKPDNPEELAQLLQKMITHEEGMLSGRTLVQNSKEVLGQFASRFTDIAIRSVTNI